MSTIAPPPPPPAPPGPPPVPPPAPPAPPPSAPARPPAAPSPGRASVGTGFLPTSSEWFDIAGLGLLLALGLFGFQSAYGGSRYLIAGVVGVLLGFVVALWSARTRQPLLVVTAATVVVFLVFGAPVAVPDHALGGFIPTPGSVAAMVDGAIQGWARLLTTLPPVGTEANLLVVPFACGLLGAVISLTIARRTRRVELAVIPTIGVLVLSILFGTDQPSSLILQGVAFAVVAIGWVSMRRRAVRRVDVGTTRTRRRVGAAVSLAVIALAALLFGQSIPGAGTNARFVLRDHTEPPFDPRSQPSPLSSYRLYSSAEAGKEGAVDANGRPTGVAGGLRGKTLFTVTGMKPGERLRLAVMDTYDGTVFQVGNRPGSSGYFQRVGEQVPLRAKGTARHVTVTVGDYDDVWVPGAGYLSGLRFDGPDASKLQSSFSYNLSTGTGAVGARLKRGDRYELDAVLPPERTGAGNPATVTDAHVVPVKEVQGLADTWVKDLGLKGTSFEQVQGLLDRFGKAYYSDGTEAGTGAFPSLPGHHARRLTDVAKLGESMVGNDEQYAPMLALMSDQLGLPARVVMGFQVPGGAGGAAKITGENVTAWVEVAVDGVGWVALKPVNRNEQVPPPKADKPTPQQSPVPPPPPPPVPPADDTDALGKLNPPGPPCKPGSKDCPQPCTNLLTCHWQVALKGLGVATLPILVLGSVTGVVGGLKLRRRTRRRTRGALSTRVAGGWNEVMDLAADLGSPIPVIATRTEGAHIVGSQAAGSLARHADAGIFGPDELTDGWVEQYWRGVDDTRTAMTADLSRFEKWRVLVSLASLRSSYTRHRVDARTGTGRRSAGELLDRIRATVRARLPRRAEPAA